MPEPQGETLFKPPRSEGPPKPFTRTLKANDEYQLVLKDPFTESGKKDPRLKDGEDKLVFKENIQFLVHDVESKVYSDLNTVPKDLRILVQIIDPNNPYREIYGYLERWYFKRKVPDENPDQQKLDTKSVSEDLSFLPPELQ